MWNSRLTTAVWSWPRAERRRPSAVVVGVPTDVIDSPFFTRMTPAR
jgi:hypothetical protein